MSKGQSSQQNSSFQFSPHYFQGFEQKVVNHIDSLTDLQVRMLMSSIFVEQDHKKDGNKIDQNLIKIRELWAQKNGAPVLSKEKFAAQLKQTMQVAFDYFAQLGLKKDSLASNGRFANYMLESFGNEPNKSIKIMRDFCDYLGQLSLKSPEQRKIFLESFPPEAGYLNCLDGTSERIETLYRNLIAEEKHKPFLQVHEEVMLRSARMVEENVFQGNEVHVPSYLKYSLGLTSNKIIHPQSQIPAATSFEIHRDYSPLFKHLLKQKILEIIAERREGIEARINNIREVYPQLNFDHSNFDANASFEYDATPGAKPPTLLRFVNGCLKDYAVDASLEDPNFVAEGKEEGAYFLSEDLLRRAVTYLPALEFLNEFPAQEEVAALSGEVVSKHGSLQALRGADSSVIFSEAGVRHVLNLLTKVDQSAPTNHEEILVGLEMLWIMGEHLAGNCPIAFVGIVRELNKISPNYLSQKIAPQIQQFFPNQVEKIQRIQERFDVLNSNPNIAPFPTGFELPQIVFNAPIGNLFYGNAPKEVILRRIADASSSSALINEMETSLQALVLQPSAQSSSEITPYEWACRQLMLRPDSREIFEALLHKMNQEATAAGKHPVLPIKFLKKCLAVAADNNQASDCKFLVNKFGVSTEIFQDSNVLQSVARHNNSELMTYFIKLFANLSPSEVWRINQKINGSTPAIVAASYGNVAVLRTINDAGVIGAADKVVLAHAGAAYGKVNVVNLVAELGGNLTGVDGLNSTAAHFAAHRGHANVIRALAKGGVAAANFNTRNDEGCTPMVLAIAANDKNTVVALSEVGVRGPLLDCKDSNGRTPLHLAASRGYVNIVELLCALGADLNQKDKYGDTALHTAINDGREDVIIALVKAGADVNLANKYGKAPLQLALRQNVKLIKILCDAGANPNRENQSGETLIYQLLSVKKSMYDSISSEAFSSVKVLIAAGAKVNHLNKNGESALHLAIKAGNLEVFRALRDLGADFSQRDGSGQLPVLLALQNGNTEVLRRFNLNAPINEEGDTLLTHSIKEKKFLDVRNLIEAGAVSQDRRGVTPYLNLAAYVGSQAIVNEFLVNGVNINNRDAAGETALHYAAKGMQIEMMKYLRHYRAKDYENIHGDLPEKTFQKAKKKAGEKKRDFESSGDSATASPQDNQVHSSASSAPFSPSSTSTTSTTSTTSSASASLPAAPPSSAAVSTAETLSVVSARDVGGQGKPSLKPNASSAAAAVNDNVNPSLSNGL